MNPKPEIRKSDAKVIQKFLSNFSRSRTLVAYKSCLNKYFTWLDVDPDEYIIDVRKLKNKNKIKQFDVYENDVTDFWEYLNNENYAPKTVRTFIACIRVFLQDNRIELDTIVWRRMVRRGNGSSTVATDKIPTHKMLKEILSHGNTMSRAIFLTQSSSGLRINQVLNIEPKEITLGKDGEPSKIDIPANKAKNKKRAITFCSSEATTAIKEWMKERDQYLITKKKRVRKSGTFENRGISFKCDVNRYDEFLFPCSENNAEFMWRTMLKKANYAEIDTSTKRQTHVYRCHTLRKFFRHYFGDKDVAEALMTHSETLDRIYDKYTEGELLKIYKENQPNLFIYETVAPENEAVTELKGKIQTLTEENKTLQDNFSILLHRMDELADRKTEEAEKAEISARLNKDKVKK